MVLRRTREGEDEEDEDEEGQEENQACGDAVRSDEENEEEVPVSI